MTEDGRPAGRPPPALRRHLPFRLGVALCLGAAGILAVAGALNVSLQREHMTGLVRESADRNADLILRSTRAAMLDNEPAQVRRILQTIGMQRGIDRIRIFDKQGRIQISTRPGEVGQLVDKAAEQCYVCHSAGEPLERLEGRDRVRIFRTEEGGRVLSVIAPIRNEPDCSSAACHAHPDTKQVLGVLDVQLSLATVDEHLAASERQMAVGLGVTVAAVLVLAGLLTWTMVLRPVQRLQRATERVAAGDLTTRAPVTSDDEIGEMTRSWNAMVEELQRARGELEGWSRTLERRVEAATRELEQAHRRMLFVEKMASLGKLAAIVAHEINNPLAGIATYAKLLRKQAAKRAAAGAEAAGDAELAKVLELVETEAARCGKIVRNLLLFSRTPGSRFAEEALPPLLERCVTLVKHQADLEEVAIHLDVAPDLPRVECDASQVQQFVLNLALNAIEAMPKGGTLTLRAARDADQGGVVLEVADTGHGISEANLQHVFEPFFTTKEEGKGVGLGLAVVYGIVQRHGGTIDVDSKEGAGTRFTVRLPLSRPPRAAGEAEPVAVQTAHERPGAYESRGAEPGELP